VFENKVLRRIFGPTRGEMAEHWRRLYNKELHRLCASPNTIMMMKSRRMKQIGDVVHMRDMRNAYKILVGK
jgi:hypothetical protein